MKFNQYQDRTLWYKSQPHIFFTSRLDNLPLTIPRVGDMVRDPRSMDLIGIVLDVSLVRNNDGEIHRSILILSFEQLIGENGEMEAFSEGRVPSKLTYHQACEGLKQISLGGLRWRLPELYEIPILTRRFKTINRKDSTIIQGIPYFIKEFGGYNASFLGNGVYKFVWEDYGHVRLVTTYEI